jgi:tetratricopeptide (TPR) repeat protein
MKSRSALLIAVLSASIAVGFAAPAVAVTNIPVPPSSPVTDQPPETVRAQLARAYSLYQAEEYEAADVVLRAVIDDPYFVDQSEELKVATYALAGGIAVFLDDTDRAWILLDKANASPAVTADVAEATLDLALELWRPEKAIAPMRVLAAQAPEKLRALDDRLVFQMNAALSRQGRPDAERIAFLQALFDAERRVQDGRQPSSLWLELARLRLAEGDLPEAIRVARRITTARDVLALQVDRRFDPVVAALGPAQLDVSAALERDLDILASAMAREPRNLQHVVELTYVLMDAGRYQDALAACDAALAKSAAAGDEPAFDDEADAIAWIHDNRAHALLGLGRVDEAITVWEVSRRMPEDGGDNVSQAINVALLHAALGRTRDALDALAGVKEASPFGWMQFHYARFSALLDSPDDPRAQESLAYLREHRADAPGTYVRVLLKLVARPEVGQAIQAVGTVKQVPLHDFMF